MHELAPEAPEEDWEPVLANEVPPAGATPDEMNHWLQQSLYTVNVRVAYINAHQQRTPVEEMSAAEMALALKQARAVVADQQRLLGFSLHTSSGAPKTEGWRSPGGGEPDEQ